MCDVDNRDEYGFERVQDNSGINSFGLPQMPAKTIIIITVVAVILIIIAFIMLMSGAAGYYSWNEFPSDQFPNKLVKTCVAMMFSPFYLVYTLAKLSFFSVKG